MVTMRNQKKFGWIPDIPDVRDLFYKAPKKVIKERPNSWDLRSKMPEVWDQGALGSCVAEAVAGDLQYLQIVQNKESFTPSKLFIYYNAREVIGTANEDSGAMIRDGIKVVNDYGACREIPTWPYDISKFKDKPSELAYNEGLEHQALLYQRVEQNDVEIESRLFEGFPVVVGISVYQSFMAAEKSGEVPMPGLTESLLGGHAILIVGYLRNNLSLIWKPWNWFSGRTLDGKFICRNSWGSDWGKCLAGHTKISTLDGREVSIEELHALGKKVWVYSYDTSLRKIVPALAEPISSGYRSDMVEVKLDNEESILCTSDHLWMMRDGSFKEASKLDTGDSLMPLYRGNNHGYEKFLSPSSMKWITTHWNVVPSLGIRSFENHLDGCEGNCRLIVHHQNYNIKDNTPENLKLVPECVHHRIHECSEKRAEGIRRAWSENYDRLS